MRTRLRARPPLAVEFLFLAKHFSLPSDSLLVEELSHAQVKISQASSALILGRVDPKRVDWHLFDVGFWNKRLGLSGFGEAALLPCDLSVGTRGKLGKPLCFVHRVNS